MTQERLIELLKKYADEAISGSGGHSRTFHAACLLWRNSSNEHDVWQSLQWYNQHRCQPHWSEKQLQYKMISAKKNVGLDVGKFELKSNPIPKPKFIPRRSKTPPSVGDTVPTQFGGVATVSAVEGGIYFCEGTRWRWDHNIGCLVCNFR